MTLARLLRNLDAALRPDITAAGGELDVASTPEHTLELLKGNPRSWRVVLGVDDTAGKNLQQTHGGLQEVTVTVVVQHAKGLHSITGQDAHIGSRASAPPLLDRCDTVARAVCAIFFNDPDTGAHTTEIDCRGFTYTGSRWLVLEGLPTRQRQLDFHIDIALDHIEPASHDLVD